ncbi:MAG: flagellar hook-basal body complex protein FliE [Candidatus Kapabacteria bacterium]|nr:flagellar hook-basal body complex protein FliE [Candidatus Kapabacteria bacterium]
MIETLQSSIATPFQPIQLQKTVVSQNEEAVNRGEKGSFVQTLQDVLEHTDNLAKDSRKVSDGFIKGEPVELHDVIIASEKAKTSFELLMQLRNKALDLYREAIRTQV